MPIKRKEDTIAARDAAEETRLALEEHGATLGHMENMVVVGYTENGKRVEVSVWAPPMGC